MDWGRAKSALIISFLLLNILLGYQLWNSRYGSARSFSDTSMLIEETNQLLKSKNIKLQARDIRKDMPKLKAVNYKEVVNTSQLVALKEPISSSTLFSRSVKKATLTKAGISYVEFFQTDPAISRENVQVYNQMYNGLPMFDIHLQLFEEKGKITGYKQVYVEVQSGRDSKEQKVISAYSAIHSVAENNLSDNAVITDVALGYHGQRYESDTQYMLPTWRIVLADGQNFYVQAFSGAVEESSPD